MKYVSFDVKIGDVTRRIAFSFPNEVSHSVVADALKPALEAEFPTGTVTLKGAGHGTSTFAVDPDQGSTTLGINPDADDEDALNLSDYGLHIRCD